VAILKAKRYEEPVGGKGATWPRCLIWVFRYGRFTITTEVCTEYYKIQKIPEGLEAKSKRP
jgi:hypothetical protein